jgi:hypothetical protein
MKPTIPGTVYLKGKFGRVTKCEVVAETTRSYVTGESWCQRKYAKKEYEVVTEAEYEDALWAVRNRYLLSKIIVAWEENPQLLRRVAELVGYVEPTPKK